MLHLHKPFKLMAYISCGYPDLSCHGKEAWRPDLSGYSHVLGMLYCGLYEKIGDKPFIYVCYNMHWQKAEFALPKLPDGLKWDILSDTAACEGEDGILLSADKGVASLQMQTERSVRIYISRVDEDYKKKKDSRKRRKENK
jgi:glycogen operon protein